MMVLGPELGPATTLFCLAELDSAWLQDPYKWKEDGKTKLQKRWRRAVC